MTGAPVVYVCMSGASRVSFPRMCFPHDPYHVPFYLDGFRPVFPVSVAHRFATYSYISRFPFLLV